VRGDGARDPAGDLLWPRGGSGGFSSEEPNRGAGVGVGPRLRGGSSGVVVVFGTVVDDVEARPLPLSVLLTARWISRSTVMATLLLSFTALPLTVWMRVRCSRVVGDCKRRRVRDGGGGGEALELAPGVDEAAVLLAWGDGVEFAM
jgi:hypothetical protein